MTLFEPLPDELVAEMTRDELIEYERILRAELDATDDTSDEPGPALVGSIDPERPPETPGELAAQLTDGREAQRPHLNLLDRVLVDAVRKGRQRIIVNIGPRYGKSRRAARWGPAWVLRERPDLPIMLVSHVAELVEGHSRWIRDLLEQHDIGIRPRRDSRAVNRWQLDGYDGGLLVAGIGGAVTGWGAGLLVIDDVIKNAEQAASDKWREKIWEYYTETLFDRLEPGASVVVIETRWHPQDLTGRLNAEQPGVWTHIRIPTVAETDDPLGREPGELLWPDRFDLEAVTEQRATLGERAFNARHQQRPTLAEGGVWKPAWIDDHRRIPGQLPTLAKVVVGCDPSGSSEGAECGIVVVALGLDGDGYVLDDRSVRGSPAAWGAATVRAALDHGASTIVVEDNYGGEQTEFVIRQSMRELLRSDVRLRQQRPVDVVRVNAGAGKAVRAEPFAALYEQGRVHHVGEGMAPHVELETQMTGWTGDGESPDRLDALVHGLRLLFLPNATRQRQVVHRGRFAGASARR